MLATLACTALMASIPPGSTRDFTVDLFLVADNPTVLKSADFIDHPTDGETVEKILRPIVLRLGDRKAAFVILDAGDTTLFKDSGDQRSVQFIQRSFDGFDSKTESVTVNGKTKTHVLEHTEMTETSAGGVSTQPLRKNAGYVNQAYVYFNGAPSDRTGMAMQDMNSFLTAAHGPVRQDVEANAHTLILANGWSDESREVLDQAGAAFGGVCISFHGLPSYGESRYAVFPPRGVVAHYVLSRKAGAYSLKLLEYLR